MTRRNFVIVGIIAFIASVIALIPARIFESALNKALAPVAQVRNTSGTIWSGSASVQLDGGQVLRQSPSTPAIEVPIQWSFAPTSLMRLRLGFNIVVLSVQLRNVDLRLAIESLSQLNKDIAFLRPAGELQFLSEGHPLQVDYLSPNAMAGRLNFKVSRVRVQAIAGVPLGVPLGSYGGHLIFNGQRIVYQIEKSSGLLSLNGGGHMVLGKPNEFKYQGFAAALSGSPVWLANAIGTLGRATSDGRVSIDYQTTW